METLSVDFTQLATEEAIMTTVRNHLPQTSDKTLLTNGGLETTLIFDHGYDLPAFAAFDLLRREEGEQVLWDYNREYIHLARDFEQIHTLSQRSADLVVLH
jgi:hypothetical protein